MSKKTPKVAYIDIETLPMQCTTFTLFPERLSPKSILKDGSIICIGVMVNGKNQKFFSVIDNMTAFKKDPYDDKHLLKAYRDYMMKEDFDLIVGHNVRGFDLKIINARFAYHGIAPLPVVLVDDTLTMAKASYKFQSNKLEHLAKFLGVDQKLATTYDMWLDIIKGGPKAIKAVKDMVKYNKGDLICGWQVYEKLLPYSKSRLNRTHFTEDATGCPHCASTNLQSRGVARNVDGEYQRYQCQDCGKWTKSNKKNVKKHI